MTNEEIIKIVVEKIKSYWDEYSDMETDFDKGVCLGLKIAHSLLQENFTCYSDDEESISKCGLDKDIEEK